MRDAELERLNDPYPEGQMGLGPFADAIGVDVSETLALHDQIFDDLDESKFGIGWWAPHPGASRRILISDHLVQSVLSVGVNIVEARLHLLEAVNAMDDAARPSKFAGLRFQNGIPRPNIPAPGCAADELSGYLAKLHVVGLFRALGSALDCLGATLIGALALPTDIVRADLKRARRVLSKQRDTLRTKFDALLHEAERAAGPENWLDWVVGMRNMYVHRPRRHQLYQVTIDAPLVHPDGRPIPVQHQHLQLPNDPERSDIEVLLDTSGFPVLEERALTSMHGAFDATDYLVKTACRGLRDLWERRRQEPELLEQPTEQWPHGVGDRTPFAGFAPGQSPFDPASLTSNAAFLTRLKAAALEDTVRHLWENFD
jgi:hypothetical protein